MHLKIRKDIVIQDTIRRRKRREKGICWDCNRIAAPGYTRCPKHLYANSKSAKNKRLRHPDRMLMEYANKREYRRAAGLCLSCGILMDEEIKEGRTKCVNCSEGFQGYHRPRS